MFKTKRKKRQHLQQKTRKNLKKVIVKKKAIAKKKTSVKKRSCIKQTISKKQNKNRKRLKRIVLDKAIEEKIVAVTKDILLIDKDDYVSEKTDYTIFNDVESNIKDPLVGTPKEVREELDSLALRMQKHPKDFECFDKIHFYIHKYLLGLVFKKYSFVKGHDEGDMYQESLIALFKKAIPKFDPNKGMSFLNFAKMCINRHLITILNSSIHRKKGMPLNTAISMDHAPSEQDDGEMSPLSNVIPDDNNKTLPYKRMCDKEIFLQTLEIIKEKLSEFEIVVLEEYLNEKSYREVSRSVSKRLENRHNTKSIDNALLRIRKKAQEILKNMNRDDIALLAENC